MLFKAILLTVFFSNICCANYSRFEHSSLNTLNWSDLKFKNIVKQQKDYSCAMASVATILTYFYNIPTTEEDLLKKEGSNKTNFSFYDIKKLTERMGFKTDGYALDYENLKKITFPVIVYLNNYKYKYGHISVLKGINDSSVLLADSIFGNSIINNSDFMQAWANKDDKGMILVINSDKNIKSNKQYFNNNYIDLTKKMLIKK